MENLRVIFQNLGMEGVNIKGVAGGDINAAFCATTPKGEKYFIKVNDAGRFPGMFQQERIGLDALRTHSNFIVPQVIDSGVVAGWQYLMLEWMEKGSPNPGFWEDFGRKLAVMHKKPQPWFGWESDNYMGSLPQKNKKFLNWADFYTECRVMPLVKQLVEAGSFTSKEIRGAERFCRRLPEIFVEEPPSLLHGDLWAGNYSVHTNGKPVIFDPAVYYGHREMDIGMTKLFGGYENGFYDAYHQEHPLPGGWHNRLKYTQLYPLLVHALLFGGYYVGRVRTILNEF